MKKRRILLTVLFIAVAGLINAAVITLDGTTQRFKRILCSLNLVSGDRIVVVKNPTRITGGTVLADSTVPASTPCSVDIKMIFKTR